jgi:hypothetical protein
VTGLCTRVLVRGFEEDSEGGGRGLVSRDRGFSRDRGLGGREQGGTVSRKEER